MSITRTGWGKPKRMKYGGRHSWQVQHTKCPKCGWTVDLDEPHTKTHPAYGHCYFYHEWCFPIVDPVRKEMTVDMRNKVERQMKNLRFFTRTE